MPLLFFFAMFDLCESWASDAFQSRNFGLYTFAPVSQLAYPHSRRERVVRKDTYWRNRDNRPSPVSLWRGQARLSFSARESRVIREIGQGIGRDHTQNVRWLRALAPSDISFSFALFSPLSHGPISHESAVSLPQDVTNFFSFSASISQSNSTVKRKTFPLETDT